jgi:hypothetical protein
MRVLVDRVCGDNYHSVKVENAEKGEEDEPIQEPPDCSSSVERARDCGHDDELAPVRPSSGQWTTVTIDPTQLPLPVVGIDTTIGAADR